MEENKRVSGGEENEKVGFDGEEVEEDEEMLKKRILCHPLFGLLIETHLNCLKVGVEEYNEVEVKEENKANIDVQDTLQSSTELDLFMEAYCMTLKKLKKAVEEPLQETVSFIDAMYIQLREITQTTHHNKSKPDSSTR